MPICEKLEKCPFFNERINSMPKYAQSLRDQYCLRDNTRCARYKVSIHNLEVPWTLFPDDEKQADLIISSGDRKQ